MPWLGSFLLLVVVWFFEQSNMSLYVSQKYDDTKCAQQEVVMQVIDCNVLISRR